MKVAGLIRRLEIMREQGANFDSLLDAAVRALQEALGDAVDLQTRLSWSAPDVRRTSTTWHSIARASTSIFAAE